VALSRPLFRSQRDLVAPVALPPFELRDVNAPAVRSVLRSSRRNAAEKSDSVKAVVINDDAVERG